MNQAKDSELNLNLAHSIPVHKKSKSALPQAVQLSAFGSSTRKVSKFDIIDPLNFKMTTPGPGNYTLSDQFSHRSQYSMTNHSEIECQYLTQKHFQDPSAKISFKKKTHSTSSDLNTTRPKEPQISFPKSSAERGLWDSNNYYHPYKLPDKKNPGPGAYEKHYQPIKGEVFSWIFKSQKEKFDEFVPRGVGPGSYSAESPRKLPDWKHFGSKAQRNCKIKLDDSVILAPSPDAYTPYVPGVNHSSTYVFNSGSKRGCQTFPPESVGPGAYMLEKGQSLLKPVTFSKTEREKFEYFKGKEGVGPAHYVNSKNHEPSSRSCSFELYSERFYPVDKTGVFLIPEDEDERDDVIVNEKVFVRKRNKVPFNSSVERHAKTHETWIKKKVAPDPGVYDVKDLRKIGFHSNQASRFQSPDKKVPGPGEYELAQSLLKPVKDSFKSSF
jgi:hypothetical protein